jgi:hypothetical protein
MAGKIKAATVPVVKHAEFTVFRKMGTRSLREFRDDLAAKIAEGYKVYQYARVHGGVKIQLGKTEEWPFEEFLGEVQEMLGPDC